MLCKFYHNFKKSVKKKQKTVSLLDNQILKAKYMTVDNYREAFKLASTQSGKESEGITSKQRSQKLATRKLL